MPKKSGRIVNRRIVPLTGGEGEYLGSHCGQTAGYRRLIGLRGQLSKVLCEACEIGLDVVHSGAHMKVTVAYVCSARGVPALICINGSLPRRASLDSAPARS
jgi:hypothetical protein